MCLHSSVARISFALVKVIIQCAHTDWENIVRQRADRLCKQLGVLATADMEGLLQRVTLVGQHGSFTFDAQKDKPPGTLVTMLVLLLPPRMVCCLAYS